MPALLLLALLTPPAAAASSCRAEAGAHREALEDRCGPPAAGDPYPTEACRAALDFFEHDVFAPDGRCHGQVAYDTGLLARTFTVGRQLAAEDRADAVDADRRLLAACADNPDRAALAACTGLDCGPLLDAVARHCAECAPRRLSTGLPVGGCRSTENRDSAVAWAGAKGRHEAAVTAQASEARVAAGTAPLLELAFAPPLCQADPARLCAPGLDFDAGAPALVRALLPTASTSSPAELRRAPEAFGPFDRTWSAGGRAGAPPSLLDAALRELDALDPALLDEVPLQGVVVDRGIPDGPHGESLPVTLRVYSAEGRAFAVAVEGHSPLDADYLLQRLQAVVPALPVEAEGELRRLRIDEGGQRLTWWLRPTKEGADFLRLVEHEAQTRAALDAAVATTKRAWLAAALRDSTLGSPAELAEYEFFLAEKSWAAQDLDAAARHLGRARLAGGGGPELAALEGRVREARLTAAQEQARREQARLAEAEALAARSEALATARAQLLASAEVGFGPREFLFAPDRAVGRRVW